MAEAVYIACALTSVLCAGLLIRSWLATRTTLLMWCAVCFIGLALNNVLLFIDKVVVTEQDLSTLRALPAALGVAALVWGLIWETRE